MIEKLSGYVRVLFGMLSIVLTLVFFTLYIIGMSRLAQSDFAITTSAFAAPCAFVMHFALIRNNAGKKFVANLRNTQRR